MERLRRRAEFVAAAKGPRAPVAGFVLQTRRRDDDGPARVGFTVSRKVGTAVERNRVRRRLKEMIRLADPERVQPGHDYVLVGRRAALGLGFDQLTQDFQGALRRLQAGRGRPARARTGSSDGAPQRPESAQ